MLASIGVVFELAGLGIIGLIVARAVIAARRDSAPIRIIVREDRNRK